MKFGFRTGGFRNWKIEAILEELARIGFDGAELCLESADMRPENLTRARRQFELIELLPIAELEADARAALGA